MYGYKNSPENELVFSCYRIKRLTSHIQKEFIFFELNENILFLLVIVCMILSAINKKITSHKKRKSTERVSPLGRGMILCFSF